MIYILFAVSRVLLLITSFIAQKTVPYLGFFPLKEFLPAFGLPSFISAFANFDGLHYVQIAQKSYAQYEQAFFPLYPLFIHGVTFFTHNELVSGLLISNCSFFLALVIFQKILILSIKDKKQVVWFTIFLFSFTTSFFFAAVYTEGFFFLLFSLSLYFFLHKKYAWVVVFSLLTSLTRLIGIFLIIPFFFQLLAEHKGMIKSFKPLPLLSPLFGLFIYMGYLWMTTGDPLIFFNAQPKFGANRSTHLIFLPQVLYRYFKILTTAAHDSRWAIAGVELIIFSVVFCVLIADLIILLKEKKPSFFLMGINLFSFVNLILPTLTGTFSSVPRYALFSFSFFLLLAKIKSTKIKIILALLLAISQVVLLSLFIQGYFVG